MVADSSKLGRRSVSRIGPIETNQQANYRPASARGFSGSAAKEGSAGDSRVTPGSCPGEAAEMMGHHAVGKKQRLLKCGVRFLRVSQGVSTNPRCKAIGYWTSSPRCLPSRWRERLPVLAPIPVPGHGLAFSRLHRPRRFSAFGLPSCAFQMLPSFFRTAAQRNTTYRENTAFAQNRAGELNRRE